MAGTLITDSLEQLQEQRLNFIALSITNLREITASEIALGSRIVISGSVIKFTANESMGSNWWVMGTGDVYAYINGTTYLSTYTQTAPVWNTEKQGWYDVTGAHRYYAQLYKNASGEYTQKCVYTSDRDIACGYSGIVLLSENPDYRRIRFYNDAYIIWDEVAQQWGIEGKVLIHDVNSWHFQDGVLIAEQSGAGVLTFYLKKPVSGYIIYDANSSNSYFYIYQNGEYRQIEAFLSGGGDKETYKYQLNPGLYRFLVSGGTGILRLYCTGVFGATESLPAEIVEII
jgi:hypothetical protein